jgi:putative addiction module component (TIGR02574 family)
MSLSSEWQTVPIGFRINTNTGIIMLTAHKQQSQRKVEGTFCQWLETPSRLGKPVMSSRVALMVNLKDGREKPYTEGITKLSTPEKILLVEDLWDNIASDESAVPFPQSHRQELDRRLKRYESAPGTLLSLEELQTRIERRK